MYVQRKKNLCSKQNILGKKPFSARENLWKRAFYTSIKAAKYVEKEPSKILEKNKKVCYHKFIGFSQRSE